MQRKTHLLSNLKKQVLLLKSQLDTLQHHRNNNISEQSINHHHHNNNNRSTISYSSRFDSSSYDSTYLDRGVKKFPLKNHIPHNLNEIIKMKSIIPKPSKISSYRQAQNKKTKENFSAQHCQFKISKIKNPNPLTGIGYKDTKKGIRTEFPQKQQSQYIKQSYKKHFHMY